MTGSMYASVAGLRAHMQKLTVIGNNVANVNTQGYKKQRTVFRDSVYSLYSAGSNGTESVGGMNPSQLGYGSMIGSIDLNMSSASYNPGNPMDCALVGDGFFLVGTKDVASSTNPSSYNDFTSASLKSLNLTRVGDFKFGPDNYLVDGKGNVVYGFMNLGPDNDGEPIISDQLVPIRLPRWEEITDAQGKKSYAIRYARVDIGDDDTPVTDATGGTGGAGGTGGTGGNQTTGASNPYITPAHKLVDDKPKYYETNNQGGGTANPDDTQDVEDEFEFAKLDSISIDSKTGCISGISKDDNQPVIIGYLAIGSVTNPNGVTHIGNSYYQCRDGAGDLTIGMLGNVQKDLGIHHVNGSMAAVDANAGAGGAGGAGGTTTEPEYKGGTEILSGDTEMMVGFLESPNVDLAEEISELITTQRGYQANTRIITVTDSMLEELVNMKR